MTDVVATPVPAGAAVPLTHGGPPGAAGPAQPFQIVPLAGLPIVAVALVGVVVAIAFNKLWGIDFFHVVAGALWTGIDLFLGFIIGPIMGRMSIPARVEFSKRLMPKMLLLMPTLVICTLAAGWQLRPARGQPVGVLPEPRLGRGQHGRGGRDGHSGHRAPGAGQPGRALRAEKACSQWGLHREADEALHLHSRRYRSYAGRHVGHYDEVGIVVSSPQFGAGPDLVNRKLPPVAEIAVLSMALVIAGGIFMAAHLPAHPPLGLAEVLLVLAVVVVATNVVLLATTARFCLG